MIGCWVVGDVVVDPGPASCLDRLLAGLGDTVPRTLLLTHIHLDHAGATGSLVERWPELQVYVHERGAPHLVDPSRLLDSARRLYGEDMERLWGEMVPVPEENLHVLSGGERLLGGEFEVAYTPGHASHHVSYLHAGTAFAGDAAGVRITGEALTIPPTPPPDIDLPAWHESIERIRAWHPARVAITHFDAYGDVDHQLDELAVRLDEWGERARDLDQDEFIERARADVLAGSDPELLGAYVQAAPPEQLYAGLERYWRKRAQAIVTPSSNAARRRG